MSTIRQIAGWILCTVQYGCYLRQIITPIEFYLLILHTCILLSLCGGDILKTPHNYLITTITSSIVIIPAIVKWGSGFGFLGCYLLEIAIFSLRFVKD